jgi:lysophospholipase L1-like esterase
MIREHLLIALLALLAMSGSRSYGQEVTLHDGDRVVFYGDSITAQRLYTRFMEDFVLTRYPQLHVTFWNAGIPGDTVYGGYTGDMPTRLKRDLLPHQPTVITIMLGMNDGYYMAFNQKYLDAYEEGYRKLLDAVQSGAPAARVTLISPTPYDEVTHGTEFAGYNEVISRHSGFVKELAGSSRLGFSDFNQVETDLLNGGKQRDSPLAALLIPDRIHPAEASHWVLAAALAHSWGLSPVVSSVQLDATLGRASAAENTQVTDLTVKDATLQWTQTDNALPLPLQLDDGMIQFVLSISGLGAMDQQLLRVNGLPAARYTLEIDGKKIASFAREQLAAGVNLALYATPMENQAKGVDGVEIKRTRLDEVRFLLAIEDPKTGNDAETLRALEAKDAALAEEQRRLAQPKPHHFELSPE